MNWTFRDVIPVGLAVGMGVVFLYLCHLYVSARAIQRKRDELKKQINAD